MTEIPEGTTSIAVSLDGVLAPMKEGGAVETRARAANEGRLSKGPAGYREVGCATVSFCDEDGEMISAIRMARMPEANKKTLKASLLAEVGALLAQRPDLPVVKVADAAHDNWSFLGAQIPGGAERVRGAGRDGRRPPAREDGGDPPLRIGHGAPRLGHELGGGRPKAREGDAMDPLTPRHHGEEVAVFRHGLIGALALRTLSHGEHSALVRRLSEQCVRKPGMVLVDLSAGPARAPWRLGDVGGGPLTALASSRDTGLCALTLVRSDLVWELLVVRPTGGTFELLHRQEMPGDTAILRDAGARKLFLFCASPFLLAPLGPAAPELPQATTRPTPWIKDMNGVPACLGRAGIRSEAYRAVAESVTTLSRDEIAATSRSLQKEDNPAVLVERVGALGAADDEDAHADARRLREWADDRARLERWDEVREILAPYTSGSFTDDEDHAQHFSHLLAVAALHLGDVGEARRRATQAEGHRGSCALPSSGGDRTGPPSSQTLRTASGERGADPARPRSRWRQLVVASGALAIVIALGLVATAGVKRAAARFTVHGPLRDVSLGGP